MTPSQSNMNTSTSGKRSFEGSASLATLALNAVELMDLCKCEELVRVRPALTRPLLAAGQKADMPCAEANASDAIAFVYITRDGLVVLSRERENSDWLLFLCYALGMVES